MGFSISTLLEVDGEEGRILQTCNFDSNCNTDGIKNQRALN